ASQKAAQVLGKRFRAGISLDGLFFEAFQTDSLQVARHMRLQARWRHWLLRAHLFECVERRRSSERRPSGHGGVKYGSQRIDVGRRADQALFTLTPGLF